MPSAGLKQNPTLITDLTTASTTSPLNGRNTMALYSTGKSTSPRVGKIRPLPILFTLTTATMNPCLCGWIGGSVRSHNGVAKIVGAKASGLCQVGARGDKKAQEDLHHGSPFKGYGAGTDTKRGNRRARQRKAHSVKKGWWREAYRPTHFDSTSR